MTRPGRRARVVGKVEVKLMGRLEAKAMAATKLEKQGAAKTSRPTGLATKNLSAGDSGHEVGRAGWRPRGLKGPWFARAPKLVSHDGEVSVFGWYKPHVERHTA